MVCCFICRHENTSFLYVGLNTIPINHNHDRHNTHKILTLPLSTTQYCNLLRRRPKSLHSGRARCPKMRADAYSGNKAGGEPLTSGLCDAACRNSQVYIIVHIFMDMCNIHKYVHIICTNHSSKGLHPALVEIFGRWEKSHGYAM